MYADCEHAMNFNHVEFASSRITEEPGFAVSPDRFENHGTAVVGITLGGDRFGIKGLANKADGYFFSVHPAGKSGSSTRAVAAAVSKVRPGDVVLLMMQHPMQPGSS